MNKNPFDKEHWDRIVSLVSLALAIIAIYLSYQANLAAQKQIEAQVVVFNVSPEIGISGRAGGGDHETVFCEFNLRVVNLGGAVTAITGYRVVFK